MASNVKHIDLNNISNPDFLKKLTYKELDVLSSDINKYIVESTSKNGGHLSSNLGVIDATIALCKSFDFSKDKIIFDVGHQSYTYKVLTGRSLNNLRQKNGVNGFQLMSESPYDHFEAGHSSTSISVANGMAISRDLNKDKYEIVAFIGDSSVANGLALEGLNNLAQSNHKVIVVINDNEMSISQSGGGISKFFRKMSTSRFYLSSKNKAKKILNLTFIGRKIASGLGSFKNWFKKHVFRTNIFDNLGFKFIGPVDGHNIKKLESAFNRAKKQDKSTVVFIKTIKGKGYKYSEQDKIGIWHGVGCFDIETGTIKTNKYSWSKAYSDELEKLFSNNPNTVLISPATLLGSELTNIATKFKNRTYDVGIAEEHAATLCGGISAGGYHPFMSIYSTFFQRCYDEVLHDISKPNQNATILLDRAGLVGNDGASHQGIFDESLLFDMPNSVITMASNSGQIESLLKESVNKHGVFGIRYPKGECNISDKQEIKFGEWIKEKISSNNVAIVSCGPVINELKKLISDLDVDLYNAVYLKPILDENIYSLLKYKTVVIYNPYAIENGFALHLLSELNNKGFNGKIIVKTVPNSFIQHATIKEQMADNSILPEDIIKLL